MRACRWALHERLVSRWGALHTKIQCLTVGVEVSACRRRPVQSRRVHSCRVHSCRVHSCRVQLWRWWVLQATTARVVRVQHRIIHRAFSIALFLEVIKLFQDSAAGALPSKWSQKKTTLSRILVEQRLVSSNLHM